MLKRIENLKAIVAMVDKKWRIFTPKKQNLNYSLFDVEYCGRLFRVPINSKEFETRIKQGQSNSGAAQLFLVLLYCWGSAMDFFDEVSTLLECCAIYEPRFSKKMERTATLWEKVT
uniref:Uncharacterized protein n=1 Tax=Daphnia galeata TaxID=27404 RepID=A0A8J2RQU4_9CRUS|nr:unnamed protein product [Daphnia galeata]